MASYDMMRAYLDRVTAGELVEAEDFYTDDVKIHIKGHNVASGDYTGLESYNAALGRIVGSVDSMQVEEHDLLVSDDHAVVLSVWHMARGGEDASLNHVIVYHTTDDKISEIWIIPEDSEKDAAFFS